MMLCFGVLHRSEYHLYLRSLMCFELQSYIYFQVDIIQWFVTNYLYMMHDLLKMIIQVS